MIALKYFFAEIEYLILVSVFMVSTHWSTNEPHLLHASYHIIWTNNLADQLISPVPTILSPWPYASIPILSSKQNVNHPICALNKSCKMRAPPPSKKELLNQESSHSIFLSCLLSLYILMEWPQKYYYLYLFIFWKIWYRLAIF